MRRLVPKKTKTIWRTQVRKFHFSSICNVLPCELRLFWYSTRVLNRHLANKLPTCGRQSANCWPTVGQLLANSRPTVFWGSCSSLFPKILSVHLRTVPTKYGGFCAKSRPCGKSRSLQELSESTKKNGGSHAFFRDN